MELHMPPNRILEFGQPLIDVVERQNKTYEINTVGMGGLAGMLNPAMDFRNALFGIKGIAETMVWEICDSTGERKDPILHCQRYKNYKHAYKGHKDITNKIKNGTLKFNGDGMPK